MAAADLGTEPQSLRQFVLPPVARRDPVKQTLIQFDVPPEIQIRREIPLPTVLLWEHLPTVRRPFVAPPKRQKTQAVPVMPAPPELSAPNREVNIADLKIAGMVTNPNPQLVRPPAKTAPVKSNGIQLVEEAPQVAMADSADATLTALLSLPNTPVIPARNAVIRPANQIAASGSGDAGGGGGRSADRGSSSGSGPSGSSGTGNGTDSGALRTAGGGGDHSEGSGARSGSALQGAGTDTSGSPGTLAQGSGSGNGAARSGSASGNGGNDPIGRPDLPITQTVRFTLPKEGKFSVVVAGLSAAAPYAESVGALSGKTVYNVFIGVGLRKKWILQYCLPKTEEQKSTVKGRVEPIEPPWPYAIVRPEEMGATEREYVLVHGILKSDGRFDNLALVYPHEIDRKELLMSSLKQWAFRPASRDGVPSEVEILLIIPSQAQ